jgi:hypothetical protein
MTVNWRYANGELPDSWPAFIMRNVEARFRSGDTEAEINAKLARDGEDGRVSVAAVEHLSTDWIPITSPAPEGHIGPTVITGAEGVTKILIKGEVTENLGPLVIVILGAAIVASLAAAVDVIFDLDVVGTGISIIKKAAAGVGKAVTGGLGAFVKAAAIPLAAVALGIYFLRGRAA